MKRLTVLAVVAVIFIVGCAAIQQKTEQEPDQAITALEKSAKEVEESLRELVLLQTEKKPGGLRAVLPKSGPMGKKIVMKWNGPIEPVLKRITKTIGYHSMVLGTAPAAPIIVKVNAVREKAYYVLDSIAWQAVDKAQILVDPLEKKITLAYLPTFGAKEGQ